MTLINDRVRESFRILAQLMTINDESIIPIEGMNFPVKMVVPIICEILSQKIIEYPERGEGMIDWIFDTILYIKGDADNVGKIDFEWNLESFKNETQKV